MSPQHKSSFLIIVGRTWLLSCTDWLAVGSCTGMRRQVDCKHDYVAPFLVLRGSSSVEVMSFASRIKTPYNFVTHPVLQVVRAASFLGCDSLSQEEAWVHLLLAVSYATWNTLRLTYGTAWALKLLMTSTFEALFSLYSCCLVAGSFAFQKKSLDLTMGMAKTMEKVEIDLSQVDAHACRLHLSTALQPLGVDWCGILFIVLMIWVWPLPFLVGNPYKPSFATVTGKGPHPIDDIEWCFTGLQRPALS